MQESIWESEEPVSRRESIQVKRIRAKEKTAAGLEEKVLSKQELRKERNREAAQKSRDRKREHFEGLQNENNQLKCIISRCQTCSQEHRRINQQQTTLNEQRREERETANQQAEREQQQLIPIYNSPPTFGESNLLRIQDEESSDNVSKYFWFCCIAILVCLGNMSEKGKPDERLMMELSPIPVVATPLQEARQPSAMNISALHPLVSSDCINYCTKCMDCLKNASKSGGNLTKVSNSTEQTHLNSSKILFCRSKALFFHKIYTALHQSSLDQQDKENKEITKVMVKGKALLELLHEDCFMGEEINPDEDYIIDFKVAILEMTPVKKRKEPSLSRYHQ